jgi:hypothetical protein
MPYKDPQRNMEWMRQYHSQRLTRRRELRQIGGWLNQRSRMNLAIETPTDTSSSEYWVDPLRPPDLTR